MCILFIKPLSVHLTLDSWPGFTSNMPYHKLTVQVSVCSRYALRFSEKTRHGSFVFPPQNLDVLDEVQGRAALDLLKQLQLESLGGFQGYIARYAWVKGSRPQF